MAKSDDKKKQDKSAKGKKGKGGKGSGDRTSVAGHPRAAQAVRRAKGFGGVGGFALAALLSAKSGSPHSVMIERALIAGVGGYLLAWACAVTVWRHIMVAEIRALAEQRLGFDPAAGRQTISRSPAETPAAAETAPALEAGAGS